MEWEINSIELKNGIVYAATNTYWLQEKFKHQKDFILFNCRKDILII
jgi:hypothetical protein